MHTCPLIHVAAPPERVLRLLREPERYAEWWDAETVAVSPPGAAAPGQRVEAFGRALGRRWPVRFTILSVGNTHLRLSSRLPLGIRA